MQLNILGEIKKLKGLEAVHSSGDFRSKACIELLKEADIVCTNPPFSLFREYIAQLIKYNKKFLIIGNANAISYKEIFPLFKDNKIWLGSRTKSMNFIYRGPGTIKTKSEINGKQLQKFGNTCWFTNLPVKCRKRCLNTRVVYYTPEKYPKYDNYNAINIDKTADIPLDYPGIMGVPLTFMDKYDPEQFEIVGIASGRNEFSKEAWPIKRYTNAIQHNKDGTTSNGSKVNTHAVITLESTNHTTFYTAENQQKPLKSLYARILIKNLHPEQSRERAENNKQHTVPKVVKAAMCTVALKKVV